MILRKWYVMGDRVEYCYNVGLAQPLTLEQESQLKWLLAPLPGARVFDQSQLIGKVLEIGPRLSVETPFSSNAVSICQGCGLTQVERLEVSRRYLEPDLQEREQFLVDHCDRMTQQVYDQPVETFEVSGQPEAVYTIPVLQLGSPRFGLGEAGKEVLRQHSETMGFGWRDEDVDMVYDLFVNTEKRDPTNVELFQWAQANSEHSRHFLFKGKVVIDGMEMPETLLELVMKPWKENPGNSRIAFNDDASAIQGFDNVPDLFTESPWTALVYKVAWASMHILLTAETHNFPTGVAPFQGAETGTGGRLRDSHCPGRGAKAIAGTAGYAVSYLNIPGYYLPWEVPAEYPDNLASALQILIQASNGASDYGNKFGEPVICGFAHSLEIVLPSGERWGFIKPIMMSGGIGKILDQNLIKEQPMVGMLLIQIGGPAYRIGFGGGAASSQMQGDNRADLDFNAVQRGDAEMEQRTFRVIKACANLGIHHPEIGNLIKSIHDQGAGGPCNVDTELAYPAGARLEIREINLGDKTLALIVIWGAEFQERYAMLVRREDLPILRSICEREHVPMEVLGEITGDGRIVVHDAQDDSTPVNLELEAILGKLPQKTFTDSRLSVVRRPLKLPTRTTIKSALHWALRLVAVGSKEHLTVKVDRSVGGLVARQQCCGARQLPVSDLGVVALSHFDVVGGNVYW